MIYLFGFDSIYLNDRFSALDLIDCLSTAKAKIQDNISGSEDK